VSISPDLQGLNFWRYQRQISPGFQEFIEAVSFEHYLQTQSLITHEDAAKLLPSKIDLTDDDYILGLFDLTGELMRFAITAIATSGSPPGSEQVKTADEKAILVDLQQLRTRFEALATISQGSTGLGKEVEKKLEVMKTCVEKVEAAVYGKTIRGREGHNGWMPDILDHGVRVETY
jgi:predicted translin family RNA/ssDNA-binding protein